MVEIPQWEAQTTDLAKQDYKNEKPSNRTAFLGCRELTREEKYNTTHYFSLFSRLFS